MTSTVERLRKTMRRRAGMDMIPETPVDDDILAALLDVVERFAAIWPVCGPAIICVYCGGEARHDPDCPWLAARRACGMEPANAEDGDA